MIRQTLTCGKCQTNTVEIVRELGTKISTIDLHAVNWDYGMSGVMCPSCLNKIATCVICGVSIPERDYLNHVSQNHPPKVSM